MKRIVFAGLMFLAGGVMAAPPVMETPIRTYGTPVTVSIDETNLTKVPTSQTSGRIGIFIDNPSTNSGHMVGFLGDCTSTALAATIRPIEIAPGSNSTFMPLREDVCLWLVTTNGSNENVHYQEVMQ